MEIIKYRKDANSAWQTIAAIQGEPGKDGRDGENGKDYVLTDTDKTDIANIVIASLPNGEEVSY